MHIGNAPDDREMGIRDKSISILDRRNTVLLFENRLVCAGEVAYLHNKKSHCGWSLAKCLGNRDGHHVWEPWASVLTLQIFTLFQEMNRDDTYGTQKL